MKLCIPALTDDGAKAMVSDHFGSAPHFILYDQNLGEYECVNNAKSSHEHGQCRPMEQLADRGIVAVVCKGMGKSAIAAVERQGIKVFTASGKTVQDAIDEFMAGNLVKLDPETGCKGHSCHH